MKKLIILVFGCLTIVNCRETSKVQMTGLSSCFTEMSNKMQTHFNADSVIVYKKTLKEEAYFPKIKALVYVIYNGTTNPLDFKILPTDHYQDFGSFLNLNDQIKLDAKPLAELVIKECNLNEFNDLIIEFVKKDTEGKPMYRFICHYSELLDKN